MLDSDFFASGQEKAAGVEGFTCDECKMQIFNYFWTSVGGKKDYCNACMDKKHAEHCDENSSRSSSVPLQDTSKPQQYSLRYIHQKGKDLAAHANMLEAFEKAPPSI